MAITYIKIPDQLHQLITDGAVFSAYQQDHANEFIKVHKAHHEHHPHPLYVLSSNDLRHADCLDGRTADAWRFLKDAGDHHLAFEFHKNKEGEFEVHSVHEGHRTQQFEKIMEMFDRSLWTKIFPYHLAIVEVPALYVSMVWLQARFFFMQDIFIPIGQVPHFLQLNKWYSKMNVFQQLQVGLSHFKETGGGLKIEGNSIASPKRTTELPHVEQDEDLPAL